MEHRHLLPNEIDLLLDGDAGFGLAPLKAHVRRCEHCQGELEAARRVVELLDELPHLVPAPQFADRVLAQVQVFEPWHVALRDGAMRLVPQSRPARALAAGGALTSALLLTAAIVATLGRMDAAFFGWQLLLGHAREAFLAGIGGAVTAIFGDLAAASLARTGSGGVALAAGAFLLALVLAAVVLRALTAAYHRQRT